MPIRAGSSGSKIYRRKDRRSGAATRDLPHARQGTPALAQPRRPMSRSRPNPNSPRAAVKLKALDPQHRSGLGLAARG